MENDNKRKRPSQGLIDMMNGGWEKLEEERMKSFSYEPIYKNDTENLNISDVSESTDRSELFKTSDFVEWLEKVSPEWINIKDLEMYVSQYSH